MRAFRGEGPITMYLGGRNPFGTTQLRTVPALLRGLRPFGGFLLVAAALFGVEWSQDCLEGDFCQTALWWEE